MTTVGVLGASGYAGAELLRLLAGHPKLELAWAAGDAAAGQPLAARYPGLVAAYGDLAFCTAEQGLDRGAEVVFLALPHGRSAAVAPRAAATAALVVDLSADFRLRDPLAYPEWYGAEHPHPEELGAWVYGLPELHRALARLPHPGGQPADPLVGARKVAVPGCYPTAALLALAPLVAARLVEPDGIVIDAKSGLSGAGRSLKDQNLFVQANESVAPYAAPRHRHTPEIEQELSLAARRPLRVVFTPHLVPMGRGELATCYATATAGVTGADLAACYQAAYAGEPFVDLVGAVASAGAGRAAGAWPATRSVTGTNRAQLAAVHDPRSGRVIAAAAIDNLVKGTSGQALQCANLALGLDETLGLDLVGVGP